MPNTRPCDKAYSGKIVKYVLCPFALLSQLFSPFPGTSVSVSDTLSGGGGAGRAENTQTHPHKVIMALITLSQSICIIRDLLGRKQCLAQGNKFPK